MDRRKFLIAMVSSVFAPPPTNYEPVDSPAFRKWFADVSTKLNGTFKIPDPYPDRVWIQGNYNGLGQLAVNQSQATGPDLWAAYFHTDATSTNVTGTVVGAGIQGFHLTGCTGSTIAGVWGIATEAACGGLDVEPIGSAVLQNELSVISQYHANIAAVVGCNIVFKNRSDARYAGVPLHGVVGSNGYNRYSIGLQFDSQPRSSLGEYCGFRIGIFFGENSIDRTADGLGTVIDMSQVPSARLQSGIFMGDNQIIHMDSTRQLGIKYDSGTSRWGLYISGTETFAVTNDGNGQVCFAGYTGSAASAGAATLPANPVGFLRVKIGGTNRKIPYYDP